MPQKPKTPGKWGRASKQLSFWVLLVLLAGTLFTYMAGGKESAADINYYPEFTQELERGNIAQVSVEDGKRVTGVFKQRVQFNNRPVQRFTLVLPGEISEADMAKLREKGVQVKGTVQTTSFGSLVFMILPYVIIFGAWMLILRQMQAGGAKAFSFGKIQSEASHR
jgi:cell division protease FtsH